MFQIKLSETTAARRRIPVLFVSSTDGFTPVTPTSPLAYLSINGATWVASTNSVAVATLAAGQSTAGVYYLELTAAEVGALGWITINIQSTNARQYNAQVQVMAYDPYDGVRIGLTSIPNVAQGNAGALPTGNASGQVTSTQAYPTNFSSMAITGTGAVTAGTVNDKTGYSLATAPPTAATISTAVWSEAVRTLTAGTNIVLAKTTNITGFNDITSQSVWDVLASSVTATNSIGLQLKTNIDATTSSRLASSSYTAPLTSTSTAQAVWNALVTTYDATSTNTTATMAKAILKSDAAAKNGDVTMYSIGGTNGIDVDVHRIANDQTAATNLKTLLMNTGTVTLGGQFDTTGNTAITKSVWNQARSTASGTGGIPLAGTFGYFLDQQVSTVGGSTLTAADVWSYGTRTITDKNNFSLASSQIFSTTGSVGSVTGSVNSVATAVTVGSVNADVINATTLSADACAEIADAILNRNIATGSSTGRTVKDVMKLLRNKVTVSATTLTVYEEDGTTIAWTAAVTSDSGAIPITGVTP